MGPGYIRSVVLHGSEEVKADFIVRLKAALLEAGRDGNFDEDDYFDCHLYSLGNGYGMPFNVFEWARKTSRGIPIVVKAYLWCDDNPEEMWERINCGTGDMASGVEIVMFQNDKSTYHSTPMERKICEMSPDELLTYRNELRLQYRFDEPFDQLFE